MAVLRIVGNQPGNHYSQSGRTTLDITVPECNSTSMLRADNFQTIDWFLISNNEKPRLIDWWKIAYLITCIPPSLAGWAIFSSLFSLYIFNNDAIAAAVAMETGEFFCLIHFITVACSEPVPQSTTCFKKYSSLTTALPALLCSYLLYDL